MRDILFKNLTSPDKKRKILASSEILDKQGIRSIIHRHFIFTVKEVRDSQVKKPQPYLYVLKKRNTREQKEEFFCRMKSSLYLVRQKKLFLVLFMHSLKITLISIPEGSTKYSDSTNV